MDPLDILAPTTFMGGGPADYAVVVLKNGGFGTKHLLTGRQVPHVLSKVGPDALKKGLSMPGSPGQLTQFASAGMQAAQVGLAVANLGVGLLNLGVSAWTAWKVHKMDKKLDSLLGSVEGVDRKVDYVGALLEGSVRHLDFLIRRNALMLGLIVEHQFQLENGLIALHEAVERGFQDIHEALSSAEARRKSEELERQMRSLFTYYEVCSKEMQAGREPPTSDLRRIVDVATELIAWLDTEIAAHPLGAPQRLPLMVARAFALRMEVEARTLLDDAPGARNDEIQKFVARLEAEAKHIADQATIYGFATGAGVLVEHYVFLHRALRTPATVISFEDGRALPFYPSTALEWDDGFGRVRELVAVGAGSPPERLEFESLEEHRAWEQLSGLPQGASDDDVMYGELAGTLGIPEQRVVDEQSLRELLREAPVARHRTAGALRQESE